MEKKRKFCSGGKRLNYGFIVIIAAVLVMITLLNALLMYNMTSEQTETIGKRHLESISGDLQITISDAVNRTSKVAMEAELLLKEKNSYEELKHFLTKEKKLQSEESDGVCINVYSACEEWMIIPDFVKPENFKLQDRLWYRGALTNREGNAYITPPYLDAATDSMCFSVSELLEDGKTVVGLDFKLSKVQDSIQEMGSDGNGDALIVNSEGLIIGYTDTSLVGNSLSEGLQEYEKVFQKILAENEKNQSFKTKIDGKQHTVFYSQTQSDWYLILSVNDWALYRDSYYQLIRNSLLNLILVLVIILFYINGYRNRIQAEKALAVKEEFLSGLSSEFKEPLNRILKYSNYGLFKQSENQKEDLGAIREAGLSLSTMMDNLFSYSSILSADRRTEKKKKHVNLKSRRNRRI